MSCPRAGGDKTPEIVEALRADHPHQEVNDLLGLHTSLPHIMGMTASRRLQSTAARAGAAAVFCRPEKRSEPASGGVEADAVALCRLRPARSGWPRRGNCSGTLRSSAAALSSCCGCCCQQALTHSPHKTLGCALTWPEARRGQHLLNSPCRERAFASCDPGLILLRAGKDGMIWQCPDRGGVTCK